MALLHHATLNPSKRELVRTYLAGRSWAAGLGEVRPVASYRFDDPAGEVGLEATLLGDADGTVVHVPVTYRAAPLEGAQEYLLGTLEHSILGTRWVYDGCGDPVWTNALAGVIATGGTEAEQYFEVDGRRETHDAGMTVRGSGSPSAAAPRLGPIVSSVDDAATTVISLGEATLVVVRVVGSPLAAPEALIGRWGSRSQPLAGLVRD